MTISKRYLYKLVDILETLDEPWYSWVIGKTGYVYDIVYRDRAVGWDEVHEGKGGRVYCVAVDTPDKRDGYALGTATKVRKHKCAESCWIPVPKHVCLSAPEARKGGKDVSSETPDKTLGNS